MVLFISFHHLRIVPVDKIATQSQETRNVVTVLPAKRPAKKAFVYILSATRH